jgi:hypothetical protein
MRRLIPYGYRLFNGATLSDCQVDSYNAIQRTINSFTASGFRVPDYLLNGSHNLLSSYAQNLKG